MECENIKQPGREELIDNRGVGPSLERADVAGASLRLSCADDLPAQPLILVGLIFFAAHMVSAVTGFGANILGLPLLAMIVGLNPGKQSLIVLGAAMYLYMTLRWWKHVDRRQLGWIALMTVVGLGIGMAIYELLPRRGSTILLAVFVIAVAIRGLFRIAPDFSAPNWMRQLMLLLGGVVHGAFTTGGPLITIYARQALAHKSTFRATLAAMWLILAIGLMLGWTIGRSWDPATLRITLIGLPFLVGGIIVGERLHHRIDEHRFAAAVNLTLVIVGVVLLFSALR